MRRHRHVGVIGGERKRFCVAVGRFDPVISRPLLPDAVLRTHGCSCFYTRCRTKIVMSKLSLSSRIDKSPVGGPQPRDDPHRPATGRAEGDERCRVCDRSRLTSEGLWRQDHQAEGVGRDGTAGMEKAEMTDLHKAIGQDMLEEPAEKFHDVEVGGAWACTARFTVGEGDRAVLEAHNAAVGDSHFEDIRGEVFEGGVAVWIGLAVHVPGDVPDLWIDVFEESSVLHFLFEDGAVDGRQGFNGHKEVDSGGHPTTSVLRQPTAGHNRVDVGVVLELPTPGMQDTSKTREIRTDKARILREPFEGLSRGFEHGLVGDLWMRADAGPEGLRDSEGDEAVRPGKLFLQVVV